MLLLSQGHGHSGPPRGGAECLHGNLLPTAALPKTWTPWAGWPVARDRARATRGGACRQKGSHGRALRLCSSRPCAHLIRPSRDRLLESQAQHRASPMSLCSGRLPAPGPRRAGGVRSDSGCFPAGSARSLFPRPLQNEAPGSAAAAVSSEATAGQAGLSGQVRL